MTEDTRPGQGRPQYAPSPITSRYAIPGPGSFTSGAKDLATYNRDIANFLTANRRSRGTAPPSAGITTPIQTESLRTFQDVLKTTQGMRQEMKDRQGGHGTDGNDTMLSNGYSRRRYSFLSQQEGVRFRAYDDQTGQPVAPGTAREGLATVGVGFNMERPDARAVYREATGRSDFDAVRAGTTKINDQDVQRLFEHTIQEAEQFIQNRFRGVDLREHQRIALVSLAFNNPSLVGPNLTRMVKEGDWNGARDEILHRSNRTSNRGLASRRWREAAMFTGPLEAAVALPKYREYMRAYG